MVTITSKKPVSKMVHIMYQNGTLNVPKWYRKCTKMDTITYHRTYHRTYHWSRQVDNTYNYSVDDVWIGASIIYPIYHILSYSTRYPLILRMLLHPAHRSNILHISLYYILISIFLSLLLITTPYYCTFYYIISPS